MKPVCVLLSIVLLSLFPVGAYQVHAQIPNADFEDWTDGNPDDWATTNSPPAVVNVTQTSDAHSLASAVHGEVINFSGFPFSPYIISGTNGEGFPVNMQHPALHGWYKFAPVNNDMLFATVSMVRGDSAIGGGAVLISAAQSVYQEFVANIQYFSSLIPDTCYITASIVGAGGLATIGSTFDLDDFSFGPVSSIDGGDQSIPASFELLQNYPNPFNPRTLITYALPEASHVQLKVFNTLGQDIATLVDGQMEAGIHRAEFDGSAFPSGTYFYRLQTSSPVGGQSGEFSQVRKLLLVK